MIQINLDKYVARFYETYIYPEILELCEGNDGTNISCTLSIIPADYDESDNLLYGWGAYGDDILKEPLQKHLETVTFKAIIYSHGRQIIDKFTDLASGLYIRKTSQKNGWNLGLYSVLDQHDYILDSKYEIVTKKPFFDEILAIFVKNGIVEDAKQLARYVRDDGYDVYNEDFVDILVSMEPPGPEENDVIEFYEKEHYKYSIIGKVELTFTTLVCDIEKNKDIILNIFKLIDENSKQPTI